MVQPLADPRGLFVVRVAAEQGVHRDRDPAERGLRRGGAPGGAVGGAEEASLVIQPLDRGEIADPQEADGPVHDAGGDRCLGHLGERLEPREARRGAVHRVVDQGHRDRDVRAADQAADRRRSVGGRRRENLDGEAGHALRAVVEGPRERRGGRVTEDVGGEESGQDELLPSIRYP